jgi:hypothetical protein
MMFFETAKITGTSDSAARLRRHFRIPLSSSSTSAARRWVTRPTAIVLVQGESQLGSERMVALCTVSEKHLVSLLLSTTASLNVHELRAELLGAAKTLERLPAS